MSNEEIIKKQKVIIEELYSTLSYINKVCFETTRQQRQFHEEKSEKYCFELMNFAWSTNDFAADTLRRVIPMMEQLNLIKS